ncbi:MOSC domain-containing protein [Ornithinibacillus bavariensis]|uniref:Molybdenum cofactor biosynthesis protein n=1 Tax=Ornithinibacillus bavariensis TaxID=545502 RepID=A0A919X4Z4_9BACI|nr:MOSC domain-containing protein [Ornithinibacillus bavariensis]GIO25621.1 molybdenum cofactor biosynthesis protein [Ornithinibacillus bavariensis]
MTKPYVAKLLVGKVKKVGDPDAKEPMDKQWESGMFKKSTNEKVWLGKTGLVGDEVADKKNHGGPEKAIFAYNVGHYEYWQQELINKDIGIGAFGENLALLFLDEDTVCIGDTYQLGTAIIQVSQPRRPCWKPARRFRTMDFALRIQESGKTGWYFRVLREGSVQEGMELNLIDRPYPNWTITVCNRVMYDKKAELKLIKELANCELLAESWKNTLSKRLAGKGSSGENRVFGPNVE